MAGSGYDYDAATLSPEGKIYQIEYATKATENASTIVGMVCKDGVLLGSEKVVVSKMMLPGSDRRIYSVAKHIGIVITGLIPDGRSLVERAKEECASFQKMYGVPITGKALANRLGQFMHTNTIYGWTRPFGCTVIISSVDPGIGPNLSMIEPSGAVFGYFGCAAGKSRQLARNEIEKHKPSLMPASEAAFIMAKLLCKSHEELKEKKFELEISLVSTENAQHSMLAPEIIHDLEVRSQEAIEKEAMAEMEPQLTLHFALQFLQYAKMLFLK